LQLGKTAVRRIDGRCCFDSIIPKFNDDGSVDFTFLQDIHIFPRAYQEKVRPGSFTAA
jgi:hypothetical protein